MRKKSGNHNEFYFSNKLKKQLDQIPDYSLTIVEAPSGFGKTTAVREYLRENLPHGACEYWYTCLGESASAAWSGICELLSNLSEKVANDLKNLKMPTMDTLFYMTAYLREIHCQTETYLVVDNYQLVNCEIPRELLNAFSMHGNSKLHMIFITQQLKAGQRILIHNDNIHNIEAASFFFDRKDTANLFRMKGIRLTDKELENIYMSTEGWISAICLQMINFEETGSFDLTADIEQLVEKAIWKRLAPEEKDFLLSLAVLESFNSRQAANMTEKGVLSENLEDLIKSNDFIRYLPDKNQYSMHSILQGYLRNRLQHQSEEYQNRIFHKAGKALAADRQFYHAALFYLKVRDFEAILSMPFDHEYAHNNKENYQTDFVDLLVHECPEEILCKYPFSMLLLAYHGVAFERKEVYEKLSKLIYQTIQTGNAASQEELKEIHGEYLMLTSIAAFNDLQIMKKRQKKAWDFLGRPSVIFDTEMPWIFATISALDILWRKTGDLENTLQCMDDMSSIYVRLTKGNGAGAHSLLRAEAMLMRGEDEKAEILCYKALYKARSYKQSSICICAELILTRIAILRGDFEAYSAGINNIQSYAKENSQLYVLRMVEQGLSAISLILNLKDYVVPWLYDMEGIRSAVYSPVVPQAQVLHLKLLMMDKRYTEFYGALQYILETAEDDNEGVKYLMPKVYYLMFHAIVKYNGGHQMEALEYLNQALDIALPDKIYLPFAQAISKLEPLLESAKLSSADREGIRSLIELGRRQEKGVKIIRKHILSDKSPLTPREREVALLTKDRLSAKEVAEKLYISEKTVRTILRNVYSKLDIHSKTELISKEF